MAQLPAPGIYRDITRDQYDDLPALNASGCVDITERCPAFFWANSPLNPDYVPKRSRKYDFGTAAHLAVLESTKSFNKWVRVISTDDYKSKAAQAQRDAAYEAGLVPILEKELDAILLLRKSIASDPVARDAFTEGDSEVTLIWIDREFGIPCKARLDFLKNDHSYIADLKTTENANPRTYGDLAERLRYHQRAAWYLEGLAELVDQRKRRQKRGFWLVLVENRFPHLVACCDFEDRALEEGTLTNRKAKEVFAECSASGLWPGYRRPGEEHPTPFRLQRPSWAEFRMAERIQAGEFELKKRPTSAEIRAGVDFQRPLEP